MLQPALLRSIADWYSQPSVIPSPSVSGLQVLSFSETSRASLRRSLSSSGSVAFGMPSPSQSWFVDTGA